ncbi:uncharacterized protein LOC134681127 isoform X1 [Mytilus trossulus]|uniref:uncharacterized protein LOC134681127 isoform X1 n=1 Tax=Mytilus trossulus TaxID=6551 RepID=UPI00300569BD
MVRLSVVTLIACFVSISIVMQGADAQNCASTETIGCQMSYDGAVGIAEGDKKIICSAANSFLGCLKQVVTDCNMTDPSVVSQTIAPGKQALSDNKCGSGVGPQDCASPEENSCQRSYDDSEGIAKKDKKKICSAAKTLLDCLNKVVTDCNMTDPTIVRQTIAPGKLALSDNKCGSGNRAGSLVFNLYAMVLVLIFYKVF